MKASELTYKTGLSAAVAAYKYYSSGYPSSYRKKSKTSTMSRDLSKRNALVGKKRRRNLYQVYKHLNNLQDTTVYYNKAVSAFGGTTASTSGYLDHTSTGLNADPIAAGAIRLMSCTSAVNVVSGTVVYPNWQWYLGFTRNDDDQNLQRNNWTAVGGTLLNESGSVPITNSEMFPKRSSILKWVSLKAMFYAATASPTRIMVELVSFKDDRLHPTATPTDFSTAFWQKMSKKFLFNPIEPGDTELGKWMKVHKRVVINMDPKETTETTNTRYKELNFFFRANRKCDFDWNRNDVMSFNAVNGQEINTGNVSTDVHPKARMYILIRSLAPRGGAYASTLHASFDWVFRTAHSISQ